MTIPKNALATSWGRELWVASLFTHCVIVPNCPLENNKNNNLTLRYLALTQVDLLNKSLGQHSARGHLHSNEPRDRRGTKEEIRGPGNHKRDVCNYLGSEEKNRVHTRLICSKTPRTKDCDWNAKREISPRSLCSFVAPPPSYTRTFGWSRVILWTDGRTDGTRGGILIRTTVKYLPALLMLSGGVAVVVIEGIISILRAAAWV